LSAIIVLIREEADKRGEVATFKTRLWKISVSSEKHESESSHV